MGAISSRWSVSRWAIQESSLDSKHGLQTLWPWLVPLAELQVMIRGVQQAISLGDSAYLPQGQGCFRSRAQGSPPPSSHLPSFFPSFSPCLSPFLPSFCSLAFISKPSCCGTDGPAWTSWVSWEGSLVSEVQGGLFASSSCWDRATAHVSTPGLWKP